MNDDLTSFLASRVEATALAAADKASLRWATVTKTAPEVTIILDGQQGELRGVDCVGIPQTGQRVPVLLAGRQALVIAGGGGPQAPTAPPVPVGTIFDYAGTNAPAGYLFCDGATYPAVQYPQLAAALGGQYVFGDMFRVPDLRGRVTVMSDGSSEFPAIGHTGGEKRHQITIAEIPPHRHAGNDRGWHDRQKRNPGRQSFISLNQNGGSWIGTMANDGLTNADTETGQTGGGQPMNILQPYYTVQKIIRAK